MKSVAILLILVVTAQFAMPPVASGYYPQHPDVIRMVDKAITYLEGLSDEEISRNKWGGEEFHIVLMAIAHFKARHDSNATIVKRGIAKSVALAGVARNNRNGIQDPSKKAMDKSTYGLAVCIILLCEVDAATYKSDIVALRDALLAVQQPHGGFGYPSEQQGDTSQVQYVVLAFWAMKQNGIPISAGPINRVNAWLMRVQDVGGAWPYRATDPGKNSGLISQGRQYMSHSTALAGGSSILIAGDYFGLWRDSPGAKKSGVLPGMPPAVRIPGSKIAVKVDTKTSTVKVEDILASVDLMNEYRERVPYEKSGSDWHYYSMYSLERFETFYELALKKDDPEPAWYNEGVEKLMSNQAASGGWGLLDRTQSPPSVATCFAILFLVRSTQQSIVAAKAGTLGGGQGLPTDTTDIKVTGTKITGRNVAAAVGEMLDLLEDDDANLETQSIPDDLKLATDPKERRAQLDRLERLVRGSKSWQARRVAARLLGKSEQMRVVPTLIFALSDGDKSVRRYARDGLRFISRKFDGFGLSDEPKPKEISDAQEQWRAWYLKINPKYVFLD